MTATIHKTDGSISFTIPASHPYLLIVRGQLDLLGNYKVEVMTVEAIREQRVLP